MRSGQIRIDGGRVKSDTRIEPGQSIRIPPMDVDAKRAAGPIAGRDLKHAPDAELLRRMVLHEDAKVIVLNKPAGIAVQGGSGVNRHIDQMLDAWVSPKGEKPRLVHRLDRDNRRRSRHRPHPRGGAETDCCLPRARHEENLWSLVKGVPRKREDKISTWLVKEQTPDGDRMRIAKHGEDGADHAISYYRILEQAGQDFAWLEMEPYTGRTHQLRVHAAHIGHPILGDPKYFDADLNWTFPGGCRTSSTCLPAISISPSRWRPVERHAPLPPHMQQSWNLFGFDLDNAGED